MFDHVDKADSGNKINRYHQFVIDPNAILHPILIDSLPDSVLLSICYTYPN